MLEAVLSISSYLDPSHEDSNCDGGVESGLPIGQEVEVGEALRLGQEVIELLADLDGSVNVEAENDGGDDQDQHVQNVPEDL